MKKIDIEKSITSYLTNNQLTIIDCFFVPYTIDSFEKYIYYFDLIFSTYKENIIEYSNEGKKYIDYINLFISEALANCTEDTLDNYVIQNLKPKVQINSTVQLISIIPNSFSLQRESSKEAILNIYFELGYAKLKEYINLTKNPTLFQTYISDPNKQIIAMKFLLFKTDHHSSNKLKRDLTAKNLYNMTSENITYTLEEITKNKTDFLNYMNKQKEIYNDWFTNSSNDIIKLENTHSEKLMELEKTYESKLKIEKPAEFMKEQSTKYMISLILWSIAVILLSITLIALLSFIISPKITFNDKIINISIMNKDMTVYSSIILLAIISIILYILRIFIQMAISSKHLMEEYKQKYSLTYFYLSLVNNGDIKDEQSKNIILTSLFTKADTGLIKNDNSNDIDKTILSILISKAKQ